MFCIIFGREVEVEYLGEICGGVDGLGWVIEFERFFLESNSVGLSYVRIRE